MALDTIYLTIRSTITFLYCDKKYFLPTRLDVSVIGFILILSRYKSLSEY